MKYIVVDSVDERLIYKGLTKFQDKEYVSFTCKVEDGIHYSDKDEAEQVANNIKGKVKEIKK
mgnify:CR=1 FL=1